MRQVISLSLPKDFTKEVKSLARKRGFSSVSSYIRRLVEIDKDLISERQLLNSVKIAEEEYKKGKAVTAKSLSELL
ncbi:ribbon-helix-helix domain-containing protein [Patescibacteria group bacterium]|nr:ribbon-helix-helix domain-containing protein [Patescibacteria group bacterium]